MLKLIIFAEPFVARAAPKQPSAMRPHVALALDACGVVAQRAPARMGREAVFAVADLVHPLALVSCTRRDDISYPCLAKVANCSDQSNSGSKLTRVLDETVSGLLHALGPAACATHGQTL